MNLISRYIFFCIIATLVNLLTQRIFLDLAVVRAPYFIALIFGTIMGLITKYFLDKNFIFNDYRNSFSNNYEMFSRYTFNGVFTTIIFWGTESFFFFVYATSFARELGAVIGLSIGYCLKYRLDERFVFQK